MSLLRLLTAGKSLVGLRNSEHRYHLNSQRALPRFRAKQNPFRASVRPESPPSMRESMITPSVLSLTASEPVVSKLEGAPSPVASSATVNRTAPPQFALKGRALKASGDQIAGFMSVVTERMTKLFRRGSSPRQEAPVPRFAKPLVQGELTLERVRVMRNDLSDTDFEVVSKPTPVPAPPAEPAEKRERSWQKMAGHIFGAGKL